MHWGIQQNSITDLITEFGNLGVFVLIKPHHICKAEAFAKKYGTASVLIGRVIPIVPFKVFSIAAGITRIPIFPFLICTLIGVLPRMYLLAFFGAAIVKYKKPAVLILFFIAVIFLVFKITRWFYNGRSKDKQYKIKTLDK